MPGWRVRNSRKGIYLKCKLMISIVMFSMLLCITAASAQESGGITPGSKIKISSGGKVYTGTLNSFGDNKYTLLSMDGSAEKSFLIEDISKMEQSTRTGSHWKRGALIGAGAGLTWGLIALNVNNDPVDDYLCGTGCKILGMGLVTTAGGAAGGLIGLLFKTEQWEEIPVGRGFDINLLPAPNGGYVTLTFLF